MKGKNYLLMIKKFSIFVVIKKIKLWKLNTQRLQPKAKKMVEY